MKWLGRILWLTIGLLWRLIVLLLFEKWVPFPERGEAAKPPAQPRSARRKERRARNEPTPAAAPRQAARKKRAQHAPIFAAKSIELSPELAAQQEGADWLSARRARAAPSPAARGQRESLAALLRDRRALRDAVVLGAALGARRSRP